MDAPHRRVQTYSSLTLLIGAALLASACGGGSGAETRASEDQAQAYIGALKSQYLPARRAFLATFGPCHFTTDWSVCRQGNSEFIQAANGMLAALTATEPPAQMRKADERLRSGVKGLVRLTTEQNACIDAGKADACASLSLCCNPNSIDLSNAIVEINALVPEAQLPAPNE